MKSIIVIARILSSVFRPIYYPTIGVVALLSMTYMSLLPWRYKLLLLGIVYLFTVLIPALCLIIYRRIRGWKRYELRHQHKRWVPYIIYLSCYMTCMYIMMSLRMPRLFIGIILVSILIQCSCIIINMKWKISMHSAGSGAIIGALLAYSAIFGFNPVWWLCLAVLISGLVMTSRMLLRQHSLWQVLGGTLVGILCSYFGLMLT